jgi:hypothetical protein
VVAVSSMCQQAFKCPPGDICCCHIQSRSAELSEQHRPCWWIRQQLRIAARLKIIPGKSERWIEFERKVGCTIAQLQQTELDHLMPPARKPKCRFMNLHRIVRWSTGVLNRLRASNYPRESAKNLRGPRALRRK